MSVFKIIKLYNHSYVSSRGRRYASRETLVANYMTIIPVMDFHSGDDCFILYSFVISERGDALQGEERQEVNAICNIATFALSFL